MVVVATIVFALRKRGRGRHGVPLTRLRRREARVPGAHEPRWVPSRANRRAPGRLVRFVIRAALLPLRGVGGRPGCLETTRCAITHTATTPLYGCAGAVGYHSNSDEDFLLTKMVH